MFEAMEIMNIFSVKVEVPQGECRTSFGVCQFFDNHNGDFCWLFGRDLPAGRPCLDCREKQKSCTSSG